MSVPASRTSRQCRLFMAPAVPTGMNAGVRMTPCGVVRRPVRAAPSTCNNSKWLGSLIVSRVTAQPSPVKGLTKRRTKHMDRADEQDRDPHLDEKNAPVGGG